ncbi:MAG: hypothetical protein V4671_28155 [Armatimonadota bacterium]
MKRTSKILLRVLSVIAVMTFAGTTDLLPLAAAPPKSSKASAILPAIDRSAVTGATFNTRRRRLHMAPVTAATKMRMKSAIVTRKASSLRQGAEAPVVRMPTLLQFGATSFQDLDRVEEERVKNRTARRRLLMRQRRG